VYLFLYFFSFYIRFSAVFDFLLTTQTSVYCKYCWSDILFVIITTTLTEYNDALFLIITTHFGASDSLLLLNGRAL